MNKYDEFLDLIIAEKKKRKLTLNKMAELGMCHPRSMNGYLYREKKMPAEVMFQTLEGLEYEVKLHERHQD